MTYLEPKYPLFVDVVGALAVVVGAGSVAERKVETLMNYGARVRVIAPEATEAITAWAAEELLELVRRPYEPSDLEDAFLVICATDDTVVNQQVYEEAHQANRLVNVVDVPELCNFYVPSVVRRGPLQIAISTSGASPTVAKQIRKDLEARYSEEWADYVALLGSLRALVLEQVPGGEEEHKPLFSHLASSNLYERIAAGEHIEPERAYRELVAPLVEGKE